jgi:hypothetical protein
MRQDVEAYLNGVRSGRCGWIAWGGGWRCGLIVGVLGRGTTILQMDGRKRIRRPWREVAVGDERPDATPEVFFARRNGASEKGGAACIPNGK